VSDVLNIGFVLEQALGHVTHAANIRAVVADDDRVRAEWLPIEYEPSGVGALVPFFRSNWTVRAGVRARRAIGQSHRQRPLDVMFVHTQVPAVLNTRWMRRIPTVVSIDATPLQYDSLGTHYDHRVSHRRIERVKFEANRRCFDHAAALVAWSSWAKSSLVDDYQVPAEKVIVIPPGVWTDRWARPTDIRHDDHIVRILFVGADLDRKGGTTLLEAFRRLRTKQAALDGPDVELHVVTKFPFAEEPGVHVHVGLGPNSVELLDLFHQSDIFCLPTRADMLALVLCEAGAAGLPVVATAVGGIPEILADHETGLVVPPDDPDELARALSELVADPQLARKLGDQGEAAARERFDARINARRIIDLLCDVAETHRLGARTAGDGQLDASKG
jgi:glycosyltransferase involved in cell wall biosynthesis